MLTFALSLSIHISVALVLLAIAPTAAIAGDDEPVRAPYVEVGDCWSYRAIGIYNHGPINDYELCVNFVDRAKDIILATATVKNDGREIDLSYTLDWGCGTWIVGLICAPATNFLRFPLHIGDKFSVAYEYRNAIRGSNIGTQQFDIEVVGWEDVTVPAGTFHSIKVVARGSGTRNDGTQAIERTWWYVPDVNRYVKFVAQHRAWGSWSEELTGYRLNK